MDWNEDRLPDMEDEPGVVRLLDGALKWVALVALAVGGTTIAILMLR